MTFSSITFVVFFVIVYLSLLLFNSKKICAAVPVRSQLLIKKSILLIASYIFYGWWDWRFCFLMLFLTATAWCCAKSIFENKARKFCTVIGVAVPLIVLGFFKYFNFFVSSFTTVFHIESPGTLNIILPVGISFFTFQSMSYTIDVLRGKIKSYSFLDVALYVAFFPQLVAGPIVKASDFMPQLEKDHKLKLVELSEGFQIFLIGLFKKLVVADNLSVFVDDVFAKPLAFSSLTVILSVVSYSIQIYFDFSGYSDMAVGTAKCLGYHLNRNFNMPYVSKNVTEFWKRWHISLSTWLQEYLYIPLGGNRKGEVRRYINLFITMVLGGLWHGANYTFILWGILHGGALCVHKLFMKFKKEKATTITGNIISAIVTYIFVCVCWVFFRAENARVALDVLHRMFVWEEGITQIFAWTIFAVLVVVITHTVAWYQSKKNGKKMIEGYYPILDLSKFSSLVIVIVFLFFIFCVAYTNANPFIYFQF
jgi:alginate O-acetyltransferase complex protein AlgI